MKSTRLSVVNILWGLGVSAFVLATGAAAAAIGYISPWLPIFVGIAGLVAIGVRSHLEFEQEMRKREGNGYQTYDLNDGYEIPPDYDVKKINERLGIKPS